MRQQRRRGGAAASARVEAWGTHGGTRCVETDLVGTAKERLTGVHLHQRACAAPRPNISPPPCAAATPSANALPNALLLTV
jgi:hypothetical protein